MSGSSFGPAALRRSLAGVANSRLSRREFFRLGAAAGGGLLLSLYLPGCAREPSTEDGGDGFEPNAFVHIAPDGTATITVAMSEMGQGVRTSLALLVAEELDLDWSRVVIAQAENNQEKYGRQGTGGSGSVRRGWAPLREAGAKARAMLVAAAAEQLGVDPGELESRDAAIVHAASGRRLGYGELAAAAARQPVAETVNLKRPADFRLIGKEHVGVDVDAIVRGRPVYGSDIRLAGMLYAVVARTPVHGGIFASYDATEALAIAGVRMVVEVPAVGGSTHVHAGLAVIADNTWAALRGRDALKIDWQPGDGADASSDAYSARLAELVSRPGNVVVNKFGDPDAVLSEASEVIAATYEVPFISHATMEPQTTVAHVEGDRCRLISPTQFPNWAARATAEALGIPPENVAVEIPLLGGGYGRRINPDFAVEAALIARQLDAPVKVIWTREDDLRHDFYRPVAMHRIEAVLDEQGYPRGWRHRYASTAISGSYESEVNELEFGSDEGDGSANVSYRIPHRTSEYSYLPTHLTRGWWRAVHTTHGTFAVESFIDELAERAGIDPVEYRLALIDEWQVERPAQDEEFPFVAERLKGVLRLAADKAGWGRTLPDGHAMGVACGIDHLTYAAEVIEVSLRDGRLRIERAVCAVDCGPVVNPNGARAQLEGGLVQGLSAALKEKLTLRDGAIEQGNFDRYSLLRCDEAPAVIETWFVASDAHPTGLGEPAVPPAAPALANALYRLTGKRYRSLPISI